MEVQPREPMTSTAAMTKLNRPFRRKARGFSEEDPKLSMTGPFGEATKRLRVELALPISWSDYTAGRDESKRPATICYESGPVQTEEESMAAKFEVFKGKGGDFRFRLKAANGKVVAQGQGYKSKDACLKGIESIKKNAKGASVVVTDS